MTNTAIGNLEGVHTNIQCSPEADQVRPGSEESTKLLMTPGFAPTQAFQSAADGKLFLPLSALDDTSG